MSYAQEKIKDKKIVVVEDDVDLLFLLNKVLIKEGYEVDCFQDGSIIFDNPDYAWPDLFLLDKESQFCDGLTLCKFIKSNAGTAGIPVIMMSGTRQFEKDALHAGSNYFLEKPVNIHLLLSVMHSLLIPSKHPPIYSASVNEWRVYRMNKRDTSERL